MELSLTFEQELRGAAASFDWPRVSELSREYVLHLRTAASPVPLGHAKSVLGLLRESLRYDELLSVADALLGQRYAATNHDARADAVARRQYAQALVERGNPAAALLLFHSLADDDSVAEAERVEARGGVGRCSKQLYLVHAAPRSRAAYAAAAVSAYRTAYDEDRRRHWHGINVVAVLARATRDGITVSSVDDVPGLVRSLAEEVLATVEGQADPDAWALATACEANIALGRDADAVEGGARFAAAPGADAFKIRSLLRQLTEVWQLETAGPPGDALLPIVRSALLRKEGGSVVVETQDVRSARIQNGSAGGLEKVLGTERYRSLAWYRRGLERCRAVARIENVNEDGLGTGFLVDGEALDPSLPRQVLMTNGHVVPEALPANDAFVVFHGLDGDTAQQRFRVTRRWWYEPSRDRGLDTTLLELDGYPTNVTPVPVARVLPRMGARTPPRAYVIGHPRGLEQPQFSLQDNLVLDYDERWVHYRSPTDSGSSGSPVFDSDWMLIGLHHSGSDATPRLNGHGGTYAANEAISVRSIIVRLSQIPPGPETVER